MPTKKQKCDTLYKYENLYPVDLWVGCIEDIKEMDNYFIFYKDTKELLIGEDNSKELSMEPDSTLGITLLVRDKETHSMGVLILLSLACPLSTLAHESVHYCDAVFDILHMYTQAYDDGNEPYAYLLTWCFEKLLKSKELIDE